MSAARQAFPNPARTGCLGLAGEPASWNPTLLCADPSISALHLRYFGGTERERPATAPESGRVATPSPITPVLGFDPWKRVLEGFGATPSRVAIPVPRFRTERARRLWALREKILAKGVPTLDWTGIQTEVRRRRGDRGDE